MSEIPDGLRPAQLGVVLVGRPVLGHAAATLVSLARRGLVTVEEADGTWRAGPAALGRRGELARFELALVDGLGAGPSLVSELPDQVAPALRTFARDLVKDALHRGWLKHTHHDQRTTRGEDLAARTRTLRTALRRAKAAGDDAAIRERLEYALVLGQLAGSDLPLARFGAAFVAACADLPGWRHPDPPHRDSGGPYFSDDEWRGMGLGGAAILSSNLGGPF